MSRSILQRFYINLALTAVIVGIMAAVNSPGLAASAPAVGPVLLVVGSAPAIGFYNEGTDFADHVSADERELARHHSHAMSVSAIPADQRSKLQEILGGQIASESAGAFQQALKQDIQPAGLSNSDADNLAKGILKADASSWKELPEADAVQKLLDAAGAQGMVIARVNEVSHGTGYFIRHKALAHYFCVDTDVTGRCALADGRLLPVHTARVCKSDMFHPEHTEEERETTRRQAGSLHGAFAQLASKISRDMNRLQR